jgi:tetratricopeptide (TPR) repeat protein
VAEAQSLLERAAQRAMQLGSPGEAFRHYTAALRLKVSADDEARLDEGAASAALSMAQWGAAVDHAQRATASHDAAGRPLDAARTCALIGRALMHKQQLSEAVALLTPRYEALKNRTDADTVLLVLTEILGQTHNYLGETSIGRGYVERMLLIAEATKDMERVVVAMTHWSNLWIVGGMPTAGRAVLARAVELARELHQPSALLRPLVNTAAFYAAQNLSVALAAAEEARHLARQSGNRPLEAIAEVNTLVGMWSSGRWRDAQAILEQPCPDESDRSSFAVRHAVRQWIATATVGEVLPFPADVAELVDSEDLQGRAWALSAQAAGLVEPHEQQRRVALAGDAARAAMSWSGTDDDFVYHWTEAVDAAIASGQIQAAETLLDLVQRRPPGHVSTYVHAELMRLRATLRITTGDMGAAVEADLRDAISELDQFGAPFRRAQAELTLAKLLQQTGRPELAAPLTSSAEATFSDLSAATSVEATKIDPLVRTSGAN